MSSGEDRKSPHELVIVRNKAGAHDDGHHGGAWKIAFADFMTALMCFFLVMWLINSTDKKTLTQVATYFNPLRLNDRLPSQKGLHDPESSHAKTSEAKEKSKKNAAAQTAKGAEAAIPAVPVQAADGMARSDRSTEALERQLLRDPYGVLDRIAQGEPAAVAARPEQEGGKGAMLPRDVFDPVPGHASGASPGGTATTGSSPSGTAATTAGKPSQVAGTGDTAKPAAEAPTGAEASAAEGVGSRPENGKALERQIRAALADLKPGSLPAVEVLDLKHEFLIRLTDEFDFGMFTLASARPTRELVLVMERIAKVLARTSGDVTVRGHTDGRPYRSVENDNWRLSMARAQVAYFMLVRGGLQESRVRRLEGHADRSLRLPANPLAAQNRRIEILIAKEQQ